MSVETTIISIGALGKNMLWGESAFVRSQHATTTLICDGDKKIIVDPSLPGEILSAKLFDRTGMSPGDITDVFCTTLRPDARRGLELFPEAKWYCSETEKQWYSLKLIGLKDSADRLDKEDADNIEIELKIVDRFAEVPEKFSPQISAYPLAGVTPGCCGLLLTPATTTVVVAGPAIPTKGHLECGMVWEECVDREQAMQAMGDLLELAEAVIPGFDNICFVPGKFY